jgi:membrane protease YdiL (CAAX protease family)
MEDADGLTPVARARKPTTARVVFWLAVLVAGWVVAILVAPAVYDLLTSLGWSRERGYAKVLRRLLLVPPVVVFFVALRPWRDGSLASYGLCGPCARARPALLAAAGTLGVGVLLLALQAAAGWIRWDPHAPPLEVARRMGSRLVGALVAAVLEEWLFRGWLYRRLGVRPRPVVRALVVAAIFAGLHAFKSTAFFVERGDSFAETLRAIGGWFERLADPADFGPTFTGLFFFSLVLTAAYLRTRTLWTPIAIHAAGSWLVHTYGSVTERTVERTWAGSKWLTDGPPAWAAMALAAWALWPRGPAVRSDGCGERSSS